MILFFIGMVVGAAFSLAFVALLTGWKCVDEYVADFEDADIEDEFDDDDEQMYYPLEYDGSYVETYFYDEDGVCMTVRYGGGEIEFEVDG